MKKPDFHRYLNVNMMPRSQNMAQITKVFDKFAKKFNFFAKSPAFCILWKFLEKYLKFFAVRLFLNNEPPYTIIGIQTHFAHLNGNNSAARVYSKTPSLFYTSHWFWFDWEMRSETPIILERLSIRIYTGLSKWNNLLRHNMVSRACLV